MMMLICVFVYAKNVFEKNVSDINNVNSLFLVRHKFIFKFEMSNHHKNILAWLGFKNYEMIYCC